MADTTVDRTMAAAFLRDRYGSDIGDVELVGEGAWSRCFGFTQLGAEKVIRFGHHVDDFERDARAARFATPVLPVPAVDAVGIAFDGHYIVSDRAHGDPLEAAERSDWNATLPSLLEALASLRCSDLSGTAGYGGWNADGNAPHATWRQWLAALAIDDPRQRNHGWRRRLEDSAYGDTLFRHGFDRMMELADALPADERYLVHADLINRNVLVQDHRITAVFDWGCSLYGDFLFDLAWIQFWTPWYPAMDDDVLVGVARDRLDADGVVVADFDARMSCCLLHVGVGHLAYNAFLGDWPVYELTAARLEHFLD